MSSVPALFKRSSDKQVGNKLLSFVDMLKVLPLFDSTDCERGFRKRKKCVVGISSFNDMMII